MPHVRANGVDLHTQVLGRGDPLAMLHGLVIGNLATWYFTAASALARRHRVLLYDLRGHGRSERVVQGYDLATMTADLGALLDDTFGPGRVSLVGHSYGALVALRFALDHPQRIKRLVLVELPLPPKVLGEALLPGWYGKTEDLLSVLPEDLRDALGRGKRQARRLMQNMEFFLQKSSLIDDLHAEPDVTDQELAGLGCPVLGIYGADSFFLHVSERLRKQVAGIRLEVLPGDHYLPQRAAAGIIDLCEEFFHG